METIPFRTDGAKKTGQKSRRRPLQPRNVPATPLPIKKITKPIHFQIANIVDSNKENRPVAEDAIAPFDGSLAEELFAIRRKLERLRLEKEKTERVLKERDLVLEKEMRDWEKRGNEQKKVEMAIKTVLKLKELRSSWTGEHLKSLRESERERRMKNSQSQEEGGVKIKQTTEKGDELESRNKVPTESCVLVLVVERQDMSAASLRTVFVYGSLMANEVVQVLLKRVPQSSFAILDGYHRFSIKGRVYPAIVPIENKQVPGKLLLELSDAELEVLDKFEDVEYERHTVEVSLMGSFETLPAQTYVWGNKDDPDLYGDWDYEEWRRVHMEDFLKMTKDFVDELEQPEPKPRVATYETFFQQE
ncbi:uncharacterized protein [Aristolochia californica]|uniref:uncharacterized protein n=1 Tax=Aristolochia californica TaxID=171875 RepID=UPI0035E05FE9